MKKVLVKSMLGLLGDLENKVMYLIEEDYDYDAEVWYAVVTDDVLRGKRHSIALDHISEYLEVDTEVTANPTLEVKAIDVQVGGGHYKSKGIQPLEYIFQYTTIL